MTRTPNQLAELARHIDGYQPAIEAQAAETRKRFEASGRTAVYAVLEPGDATSYRMFINTISSRWDGRRAWLTITNLYRHPVAGEIPAYVVTGREAWQAGDFARTMFASLDGHDDRYTAEILSRFVSLVLNPESGRGKVAAVLDAADEAEAEAEHDDAVDLIDALSDAVDRARADRRGEGE